MSFDKKARGTKKLNRLDTSYHRTSQKKRKNTTNGFVSRRKSHIYKIKSGHSLTSAPNLAQASAVGGKARPTEQTSLNNDITNISRSEENSLEGNELRIKGNSTSNSEQRKLSSKTSEDGNSQGNESTVKT